MSIVRTRSGESGVLAIRGRLIDIFAEILSLERHDVAGDRPFFEIATSSLALVDALQRVSEEFGVRPSLRRVFEEFGTIDRLAGYLAELTGERPAGAAAGGADVPRPAGGAAGRRLELTSSQQELVFLAGLRPEAAPAWYETVVIELDGPLDLGAFNAALTSLASRHEALRTRLTGDGAALLVEADATSMNLRVVDLPGSEPERMARSVAWLNEPVAIDPTQALLRVDLARLSSSGSQHLLRITAHGLIADRAAVLRLAEELAAAYAAEGAGEIGGARPAASFTAYQDGQLASAAHPRRSELLEFWRATLSSAPIADLPSDHPRPAIKRYAGDRIVIPLADETVARARSESGALGVFLTVAAAVAAWTARLSGQEDLVVGVFAQPLDREPIVANRTNPQPLRVRADETATFVDLRRRVSSAFFDAVDHGDLPFADIVRAVNPDRDQGRSPLFTVAVDREVWPPLAFGGLDGRIVTAPSRYARYDMAISLVEGPGFAHLRCDYSTELFEKRAVRRYLGYLRRIIDAGVAEPGLAVGALPLLASDERRRIVEDWNRTEALSPDDEPLFARIDLQASRTPAADAILDGDRRVSYGDLVLSANRVANRLRAIGVGPEARVAILMGRSLEAVVAMLGVMKAGGAYVPIDPDYPAARVAHILADSGARVIVTDAGPGRAAAGFDGTVLALSPGLPELSGESGQGPAAPVGGRGLAYVLYTSGSTGRPKGVAVEHRSVVNLVSWARTMFSDAELAGVLSSASFSFDPSVFDIFAPLAWGGTVVLSNNLLELPRLPMKDRVTLINSVPSALRQLVETAELPRSIRVVNVGGEPVHQELIDRILATGHVERMLNWYGPTETTTVSTVARLERGAVRPPAIGRPIGNTRVYVLDSRSEPVPPGVTGELCIAGSGVARGYLGEPEITRRSFVPDAFVAGERMYRTGDLARFREDGDLEFLGRRDHQVKVRGYRIELGEIEACLLAHPAVRDAAVLAAGSEAERTLIAWIVPAADAAPALADLRAHVGARLPAHMVPSRFVAVQELRRLPNGKVDRAGLPAPDMDRESRVATGYAAPATDIERTLASIWANQLHIERIGRHDNFFELGGHSLLLAPIMIEIDRRFGARMTLGEFFDAPTIAALASRLQELARSRTARTPIRRRIARTGPEVDASFAALRADAALDPQLEAGGRTPVPLTAPSHFFITGVTGFVGTYVFHELLRRSDARFSCLVRAADAADGRRRLTAVMQRHDLWDPSFEARFDVVPGELARPRFGIPEKTYDRLIDQCDEVMHIAAQVNFIYPYRALKGPNVDGVHHALRLAFAGRAKPFHYVSTAAIWPMGAEYRFHEEDDINHGVRLNIGYDDSKWVAEHLVLQARQRGLPATIYRPGEVAGHSVTGRCALDHFMWAIVKGSIQIGVFPAIKGLLDIGPIDYVAAAIAAIALNRRAAGGTYHLNNPHPGDPAAIYDVVREYGYRFTTQSTDDWINTLLAREDLSENALYPFAAILEEFEEENFQLPTLDTTHTRAMLSGTGVQCAPVAAPLIRRYLDYLVGIGFLQPSGSQQRLLTPEG